MWPGNLGNHNEPKRLKAVCEDRGFAYLDLQGAHAILFQLRILITTDHPRPGATIIDYDPKSATLTISHKISLLERSSRFSEYYQGAEVHEASGIAATSSYSASLKVIPIGDKFFTEFDCRYANSLIIAKDYPSQYPVLDHFL